MANEKGNYGEVQVRLYGGSESTGASSQEERRDPKQVTESKCYGMPQRAGVGFERASLLDFP